MANPKIKSESYQNLGGMNTKSSVYTTGEFEFLNITNMDFVTPNSLTKAPGTSLYVGATVSGRITGLYEFSRLDGSSYLVATANTNAYTVTTSNFSAFKTGLTNNAIFDFETFVDRLFMANGSEFFKFDGSNVANYSLPEGTTLSTGVTGSAAGFTGLFQYAYGYLNDRGYLGPVGGVIGVSVAGAFAVNLSGFTTPSGYGITAIAVYRTSANGSDLFRIGYLNAGGATFSDANLTLSTDEEPPYLHFTLAPKYLTIYNNELFMAGFSSAPSSFYFSEIGEPEAVLPESNIEVRTNDGDVITGMYPYSGGLLIFKRKSFHFLSGDNPDTFLLKEVSNQYGCISNRAIAAFENFIFFLDEKGVVMFNGANVDILSTPIESIFLSMNLSVAQDHAIAIHDRLRNQVKFEIPINGSDHNNFTLVYDYVVKAWTTRVGVEVSSTTVAKRELTSPTVFYGGYTGTIGYFGASFFGYEGQGFTASFKTRFLSPMGKTITEQYRRLYLDVEPVVGVTAPLSIDFFTNFGSTTALSRTMYQNPYQSRIDFGLPAKSLAFSCAQFSATLPLKVHGFTIESRMQRMV